MKQMTDAEYVARKGTSCPWCGSNDLEAQVDEAQADGNDAMIPVSCLACGKSWEDLYKLAGYEES